MLKIPVIAALFSKWFLNSSIMQVGTGLRKMVPELNVGSAVADHLIMTIPYTGWDFSVTTAVRNAPFVIETKSGASFKVWV